MPYHLELGSEGHSFHGKAIVVNSQTGEHKTKAPLPIDLATAQKKALENKEKKKEDFEYHRARGAELVKEHLKALEDKRKAGPPEPNYKGPRNKDGTPKKSTKAWGMYVRERDRPKPQMMKSKHAPQKEEIPEREEEGVKEVKAKKEEPKRPKTSLADVMGIAELQQHILEYASPISNYGYENNLRRCLAVWLHRCDTPGQTRGAKAPHWELDKLDELPEMIPVRATLGKLLASQGHTLKEKSIVPGNTKTGRKDFWYDMSVCRRVIDELHSVADVFPHPFARVKKLYTSRLFKSGKYFKEPGASEEAGDWIEGDFGKSPIWTAFKKAGWNLRLYDLSTEYPTDEGGKETVTHLYICSVPEGFTGGKEEFLAHEGEGMEQLKLQQKLKEGYRKSAGTAFVARVEKDSIPVREKIKAEFSEGQYFCVRMCSQMWVGDDGPTPKGWNKIDEALNKHPEGGDDDDRNYEGYYSLKGYAGWSYWGGIKPTKVKVLKNDTTLSFTDPTTGQAKELKFSHKKVDEKYGGALYHAEQLPITFADGKEGDFKKTYVYYLARNEAEASGILKYFYQVNAKGKRGLIVRR